MTSDTNNTISYYVSAIINYHFSIGVRNILQYYKMATVAVIKTTTQYMQTYRSNAQYRWREEKMRRLNKIKHGVIPRHATLIKYNITTNDINTIRASVGKSPIDITIYEKDPIETTTTLALSINTQTKLKLEKIAKEESITLKEKKQDLKKHQDGLRSKYKYKLVGVPSENRYSLEQIINYYTKHEFIDPKTNAPKSNVTMRNVFGIVIEYNSTKRTTETVIKTAYWNKKGNIHDTISRMGEKYLADTSLIFDNMKKLFDIVEGIDELPSSKQKRLQNMNPMFKSYPGFENINEKRNKAVAMMDEEIEKKYSPIVQSQKAQKKNLSVVENFDTIVKKIETAFGKTSEEHLFIKMFEEIPSRDDLGCMKIMEYNTKYKLNADKITPDLKSSIDNMSENKFNLMIMGDKNAIFSFCKYKTDAKYDTLYYPCSASLFKLVKNHISNKKFKYNIDGDFIFKSKNKDMKQSTFVSSMLKTAGVKDKVQVANVNVGSINLLRHSIATKLVGKLDPNNSAHYNKERIRISKLMKHSVATTDSYISQLKK